MVFCNKNCIRNLFVLHAHSHILHFYFFFACNDLHSKLMCRKIEHGILDDWYELNIDAFSYDISIYEKKSVHFNEIIYFNTLNCLILILYMQFLFRELNMLDSNDIFLDNEIDVYVIQLNFNYIFILLLLYCVWVWWVVHFRMTYDSQHHYSPGRLTLSAPCLVTPLCRLSLLKSCATRKYLIRTKY